MDGKKLYKSRTDKKISGVCGGLAAYFGIDVTLMRIVWILLGFFSGIGIFIYILCAIVMPTEPDVIDYRNGSGYDGGRRDYDRNEYDGGRRDYSRNEYDDRRN